MKLHRPSPSVYSFYTTCFLHLTIQKLSGGRGGDPGITSLPIRVYAYALHLILQKLSGKCSLSIRVYAYALDLTLQKIREKEGLTSLRIHVYAYSLHLILKKKLTWTSGLTSLHIRVYTSSNALKTEEERRSNFTAYPRIHFI